MTAQALQFTPVATVNPARGSALGGNIADSGEFASLLENQPSLRKERVEPAPRKEEVSRPEKPERAEKVAKSDQPSRDDKRVERDEPADNGNELPSEEASASTDADAEEQAPLDAEGEQGDDSEAADSVSLLLQDLAQASEETETGTTPLPWMTALAANRPDDFPGLGPELAPGHQMLEQVRAGDWDLAGNARGLLGRLQGDAAANPQSTNQGPSQINLPQMTDLAEGEQGLDDFMQESLAQMRGQMSGALGGLLEEGEEGKGFNHLINQINNARSMAAPAALAATGAALQAKSLDIPVGGKGWSEGVGERIQWMLGKGVQQAQIRLNPQHLGPLEIRVSMLNDQANVSIMAQHAMTKEALEQSMPRLREMLQDANLTLGNVDVGSREAPQQQGREAGRSGAGQANGFFGGEGDDLTPEVAAAQVNPVARGLLDEIA